ncbi:hypothetical protein GGR26_000772 [Lewinella marina]|uniref:DUF1415 domain-containing protein n=1 Tax=Neolewinella marina TaxID=438751 RepID=A0A2G0CIM2_9BACT|nr:DUF1415 domain-containing protein [Neolewinella marina]NJB85027.1 hypothetical protein [Neolewinella marina]PHK99825.1 hypothetical protein CGL56_01920 [Neolewinella marina]
MSPVEDTRRWVEDFVVGLGLCPFAAPVLSAGQVVYQLCPEVEAEAAFYWAGAQVQWLLDQSPAVVDTSLLIFPDGLDDFEDFLDFEEELEQLLDQSGAAELIQLAHFHPRYRFADVPADDPANATNRAPYPTVQLLRVDSVAKALARYPGAASIPDRNMALLRQRASEGKD